MMASQVCRRTIAWGAAACLLSAAVVVTYYLHRPPTTSPDTGGYLHAARQIAETGNPVDVARTPGYPLFIALVFALTGDGNLEAVSIAQGGLFVLATLALFVLTLLITGKAWMAFAVSVLAGTNTYQLSYVKPVIAEGFAPPVVITLALVSCLYLRRPSVRLLWLTAAVSLIAFMTRVEWVYLPLPLFALLLALTWQRIPRKRFVLHAAAALLLLVGVVGGYVAANATTNGYAGLTMVERINLLGKVMQYRLQHHAPSQYADTTARIDRYIAATGNDNPYVLARRYPSLVADHWQLAGDYARATVRRVPGLYLWKTAGVFLHSSDGRPYTFHGERSPPHSTPTVFERISRAVFALFPFSALLAFGWLVLMCFRRRIASLSTDLAMMGTVSFLVLYDQAVTALGGYDDYMRIHVPINPLRVLIVFVPALLLVAIARPRVLSSWSAVGSLWRGGSA